MAARSPPLPPILAPRHDPGPPTIRPIPPSVAPPPPPPPRHLLVGDAAGRAVVSRLYARGPDGPVVQLPDGSLGWPEGEVATDRAFHPLTAAELKAAVRSGPFRGFHAVEAPPYLVFTSGSEAFARDAAELLRRLHRDLTDCLEDGGLDVREPEFPLVALIFADEADFRRYRTVDPDVRAYYEVAANRIVLYERSEQDRRAPELASLRRPQTIAHEGVHQILQNVGVQPRLASWPPWLVEGLAEYYAPASTTMAPHDPTEGLGPGLDAYGRDRFGAVNPLHMATLIDLQDPAALPVSYRGAAFATSPAWTAADLSRPGSPRSSPGPS